MNGNLTRRHALSGLSVAIATAVAGCTGDDEEPPDGTDDDRPDETEDDEEPNGEEDDDADEADDDGADDGEPAFTEDADAEVLVGPGGDAVFEPEEITIEQGEMVNWVWESDGHSVVPTDIPEDATWEDGPGTLEEGDEHEFIFDIAGEYEYVCEEHEDDGMVGRVVVEELDAD